MKWLVVIGVPIAIGMVCNVAFGQNTTATGQIVMEGKYKGKNFYLENLVRHDFYSCADSVKVNGSLYSTYVDTSAFEIRLDTLNLKVGDDISIRIYHKEDCKIEVFYDGMSSVDDR